MRKRLTTIITTIAMAILLTGCKAELFNKTATIMTIEQEDIESYKISGNTQFVPISYEHIIDGNVNGIDILQYVDLKEGNIYIYTERYGNGFSTTWSAALDTNGKPVIYDNLEKLREKYNWQK